MSRVVFVDNSVQKQIESLFCSSGPCFGLIIGQHGINRDYVVHIARTPDQDENESNKLSLDEKWLSNHARQAQRMLPGGIDIVGVFIYCNPQVSKIWLPLLKQVLVFMQKTLNKNEIVLERAKNFNFKVAFHVCATTKKTTCKIIDVADYKSSLEPADLKYQNLMNSWVSGKTTVNVDHAVLVGIESCNKTIKKQLQVGLEPFCHQILNSLITVNNSFLSSTTPLYKDKGDSHALGKELNLQVFLEPNIESGKEESKISDCVARLHIRGSLAAQAYVHIKSTVLDLQMALKEDVIRSLLARCELLCEEMLQSEETEDEKILYETPKRVFVPLYNSVSVCDYLFPDEQLSDCVSRLKELLNLEVSEEQLDTSREQLLGPSDLQEEEQQLKHETVTAPLIPQPVRQHKTKSLLALVLAGIVSVAAAGLSYFLVESQ